ncbi:hypothetical protein Tco_0657905 [Tanacetum coccineum]
MNMNTNVGNNDEDEVDGNRDDTSGERRTLSIYRDQKGEVECREREVAAQEYRARQEDIRFYLQPYDHLTGVQWMAMDEARAAIKAKYNLQY